MSKAITIADLRDETAVTKLEEMAREAGRAGQDWSRWTASDEVQAIVLEASDAFDTDAIEAAFLAGRRELRLQTWRAVWTTAPVDYDNGGTETVAEDGDWYGKPLRRVVIEPEHFVYQTSRYGSGLHPTWDENPRETEARLKERDARLRAEDAARAAKREEGLAWLKTATEDELEDFDTFEARGVRYADVRAEKTRRATEAGEAKRVAEWERCVAIVKEGDTLIDPGSPSTRGVYGPIRGRDPHVYYNVKIARGWPDDADHANIMGEGHDNAGSLLLVAEWLVSGRLRVAAPGEVPPRAVVNRIGHEHTFKIKRVEVAGRVVWLGRATFGETMVLDEKGHLVRAKKVLEAVAGIYV